MRNTIAVLAASAFATVSLATLVLPAAAAQQQPAPPDAQELLLREVSAANRSLQEIADALRGTMDQQQVNLAFRRLELQIAAVADLERELRHARDERHRVVFAQRRYAEYKRLTVEDLEDAEAQGNRERIDALERQKRRWEIDIQANDEMIVPLDQRTLDLENEISRRRNEILDLENYLDDAISLP